MADIELVFDGLEIPDEQIGIWGWAKGNATGWVSASDPYALAGLAKRCMEIAAEYTATDRGLVKLAEREFMQIGQSCHEIQIGRLLVMHAAWCLDQGVCA